MLTNRHFQSVAGEFNHEKEIPDRWKEQFAPLEHINPVIYCSLMSPPDFEEWKEIIKNISRFHLATSRPLELTC